MGYTTSTDSFTIENLGTGFYLDTAIGLPSDETAVLLRASNGARYLRFYDSTGVKIGSDINIYGLADNESPLDNGYYANEVSIHALSNGNVVVQYNKSNGSAPGTSNAYFFVVDQSGTEVVHDTQINTYSGGGSLTRGFDIAELSNGNIAFTYQRDDNNSRATHVFTSAGAAVSSETLVASSVIGSLTAVAASSSGGYMMAYEYGTTIDFKFYNNTSTLQTSGTLYSGAGSGQYNLLALSNGNYLAVTYIYGDATSTGKIFSPSGSLLDTLSLVPAYFGTIAPVYTTGAEGFAIATPLDSSPVVPPANAQGTTDLIFKYYDNSGTLISTNPSISSGKYYYNNYSSYSYQTAISPSFQIFGGYTRGAGVISTTSPNAWSGDTQRTIGALLFDQPNGAAAPTVTLSVNNSAVAEAAGTSTVTATLSATAASDTTVTLTATGTATGSGTDYTLSSNTITITAGNTTGTTTVTALQDPLHEANETVILDITGVTGGDNATESGTQQQTITITDDDTAPTVSIANTSLTEGNSGSTNMTFTASLSTASGQAVSVNYATSNGTATAGSDYTATSGTLNFAAGETSKTFTVAIAGDTTLEPDETITATLSAPSNATLATSTATGTISNDDNAVPTLSTISTLTGATEDTAHAISYATLLTASNYTDTDVADPKSFRVEAVTSGTLYTDVGLTTQVTPGTTLLSTGGTWYWKAALDANGSALNAFTVKAWDGTAASTTAIQVKVDVAAVNDAPTLSAGASLSAINEDVLSSGAEAVGVYDNFGVGLDSLLTSSVYADTADSDGHMGIVITNDASNPVTEGRWQYFNVADASFEYWHDIGTVSAAAGLVLEASGSTESFLRFVPVANFSGTPGGLTIHAIDNGTTAQTINYTTWNGTTENRVSFDTTADNATSRVSASGQTWSVTVNPIADTPAVTNTSTTPATQTSSGLVLSRNAADSTEVTHFKITGITNGNLFQNDGTTQIANGDFISFAQGNAGLKFTPTGGGNGVFTAQASTSGVDGGLGGATVNASIVVGAAVASPTVNEDADSGAIAIALGSGETFYKITSITGGTLYSDATYSAAISSDAFIAQGGGGGNATTTNVYFRPTADRNTTTGGNASFVVQASSSAADGGLTGSQITSTITLTAIADTPTVASPAGTEDTDSGAIAITRAAGDGAETTHYKVTGITGGTLYSDAGYTTAISNNDFIASAGASTNVYFRPTANGNSTTGGNGAFTVQASKSNVDGGLGDSTATSTITLAAVADTPAVTNATTNEDTQSASGLVLSRNAGDGAETTHFKITGITGGTLYKTDGSTAISNGDFITFAEGNAGLKFTPTANSNTSGAFTAQASSSGVDAGLAGSTVNAAITVTPVADTPSVTAASTTPATQTTSGLVLSRNAADSTEVTHFKITGISNGTLYQNDGTTAIANDAFITFAQANAGLKFTPSGASDGTFSVQASTSNAAGGLGGSVVPVTVSVGVDVASPSINEDTDSGAIAIGGNTAFYKITGIAGGALFSDAGFTTAITSGGFIATAGGSTNVYFRPTADFNGTASFSVQGSSSPSNAGLTGNTAASSITVTAENDAPVASGSATLSAVVENTATPPGASLSSLFASSFSDAKDAVSGGSGAASFIGIALSSYTADAAKGAWQYQIGAAGAWLALGNATSAAAVTLAAADMLRFVPTASYNGAATTLAANLIETGAAAITSGASIDLTGATGLATHYSSTTVSLAHTITPANISPVITSNGGGTTAAISVAENTTTVTTVVATDPDLPPPTLSYSITGGADQAKFSIIPATGVLTFASAPNFEVPTDADTNNSYIVVVSASDGSLTDTQTITVTVTDVNENPPPTPVPTPEPTPPPTPAPVIVDGTNVTTTTNTTNGVTTTILSIVPVVSGRPEDPSTPNPSLADIPLATDSNGAPLVQVGLPTGVGLSSSTTTGSTLSLREQLIAASTPRVADDAQLQQIIQDGIDQYVPTVGDQTQVAVRTISLTVPGGTTTSPAQPIIITGATGTGESDSAHPLRQEALIIDASNLPPGTVLDLSQVEFAIIIGPATVIGGIGRNYVIGDGSNQTIVLGPDDDILLGGAGNDTVGSKGGNDQLFGDAGNDHLVGGNDADTLNGGTGNDVLQGGQSDAGSMQFTLDTSGQLHIRFAAERAYLTESSTFDVVNVWTKAAAERGHVDQRIGLIEYDYTLLKDISLLFYAVTNAMPTASALRDIAATGLSAGSLADLAFRVYQDSYAPNFAGQDVTTQIRDLVKHVLGTQSPASVAEVQNILATGGDWGDALVSLAQAKQFTADAYFFRNIWDINGNLKLAQELKLSESGWSADSSNDFLYGGDGNDYLVGGAGNDLLDGGAGIDIAVYTGVLNDFEVRLVTQNEVTDLVIFNRSSGEQDIIRSIEGVKIGDTVYGGTGQGPIVEAGHDYAVSDFVAPVGVGQFKDMGLPDFWMA